MIDKTISNRLNQFHENKKQAASIQPERAALNYSKKQDLTTLLKLSEGMGLKGKLIKQEGVMTLELLSGEKIPVAVKGDVGLGKIMAFKVLGEALGKLHLESMQQATHLHDKITEQLKLPQNKEMQRCITYFLDEGKPLEKSDLLKTYHLMKQTHLPIQTIEQLTDKLGIHLNQFLEEFKGLSNEPVDEMVTFLKDSLLESSDLTVEQKLHNSKTFIDIVKGQLLPQQLEELMVMEETFVVPQEQGTLNKEEKGTQRETPFSEQKQEVVLGKEATAVKIAPSMEAIERYLDKVKKIFDDRFIYQLEGSSKNNFQKEGLKDVFLKISDNLLEIIENKDAFEGIDIKKEMIANYKEPLEMMSKLNDMGDYYHYPLDVNGQKKEAEIYFFQPKRKNQAKKKNDFYAVIALDFPMIQHVDIHIHQIEKSIDLTIHVANQKVQGFINSRSERLLEQLASRGYEIGYYACLVKTHQEENTSRVVQEVCTQSIDMKV